MVVIINSLLLIHHLKELLTVGEVLYLAPNFDYKCVDVMWRMDLTPYTFEVIPICVGSPGIPVTRSLPTRERVCWMCEGK
jgi:hypothetical protein